jgi:hypothetical protein
VIGEIAVHFVPPTVAMECIGINFEVLLSFANAVGDGRGLLVTSISQDEFHSLACCSRMKSWNCVLEEP